MNYTKGNLPLIDTNILVYAYDQIDERKHKISNEIVKKAWEDGTLITLQNLCEFFIVITKKVEKPVSVKQAREIVEDILSSEEWIIIDRTEESQKKAMKLNQEKRIHFWDALIIASMIEYGIKEIITENVSNFSKIKSIKPINPY
ncbi:MAG TPA: PIN domain-containing protein [Candidatus Cloacimonetes bacterium]|nr:PIN domain-containing protein [Candidatus Cloacimonadota bacterium]